MSKKIQFDLKDSYLVLLESLCSEGESINQAAKRLVIAALDTPTDTDTLPQPILPDTINNELLERIAKLEEQIKLMPDTKLVSQTLEKASYLMNGGCVVKSDLTRVESALRIDIDSLRRRIDSLIKENGKEAKRVNRELKKLGVEVSSTDTTTDTVTDTIESKDIPDTSTDTSTDTQTLPISFGKTLEELLNNNKSVTRRQWKESHAKNFIRYFHEKRKIPALNMDRRSLESRQIGWLTLTEEPYQEKLANMPEADVIAEGFPNLTKEQFINRFFEDDQQIVWVIHFNFEPIPDTFTDTSTDTSTDTPRRQTDLERIQAGLPWSGWNNSDLAKRLNVNPGTLTKWKKILPEEQRAKTKERDRNGCEWCWDSKENEWMPIY